MLCLIDLSPAAGRGSRCRVRVDGIRVLGLPAALAVIEVPARPRPRRLLRALESCAGTLKLMGVSRVAFPEGFPYRDFFLRLGFREGDCRELLFRKAAAILSMAAPKRERVLLRASRADRRAARLAGELGEAFRYLVTDIPGDVRALEGPCGELGMTPEPLRRDRVADVDAAVFLDTPARPIFLPDRCRVLRLGEKTPLICGGREVERVLFRLPERLRDTLPDKYPQAELLSAALESGCLAPGDVAVLGAK